MGQPLFLTPLESSQDQCHSTAGMSNRQGTNLDRTVTPSPAVVYDNISENTLSPAAAGSRTEYTLPTLSPNYRSVLEASDRAMTPEDTNLLPHERVQTERSQTFFRQTHQLIQRYRNTPNDTSPHLTQFSDQYILHVRAEAQRISNANHYGDLNSHPNFVRASAVEWDRLQAEWERLETQGTMAGQQREREQQLRRFHQQHLDSHNEVQQANDIPSIFPVRGAHNFTLQRSASEPLTGLLAYGRTFNEAQAHSVQPRRFLTADSIQSILSPTSPYEVPPPFILRELATSSYPHLQSRWSQVQPTDLTNPTEFRNNFSRTVPYPVTPPSPRPQFSEVNRQQADFQTWSNYPLPGPPLSPLLNRTPTPPPLRSSPTVSDNSSRGPYQAHQMRLVDADAARRRAANATRTQTTSDVFRRYSDPAPPFHQPPSSPIEFDDDDLFNISDGSALAERSPNALTPFSTFQDQVGQENTHLRYEQGEVDEDIWT